MQNATDLASTPIDLANTPFEQLGNLAYARKHWFRKPVAPATIYRWVNRGIRGVKLDVLFSHDGTLTSQAACREFINRVDQARRAAKSAEAAKAIDATDSELAAVGLLPS